jgi:hypothetical protein
MKKKSSLIDSKSSIYLLSVHRRLTLLNRTEQTNVPKDKRSFENEMLLRKQRLEGLLFFSIFFKY